MIEKSIRRAATQATGVFALLLLGATLVGFVWPWNRDSPWPSGSDIPVEPLGFPTLESRIMSGPDIGAGFRFAALGDQRALADGEWQELVAVLAELDRTDGLAFIIDTGDVVYNGSHGDQFAFLRRLLDPVSHLPYLICTGNHEVCNNRSPQSRQNLAKLMQGVDSELSADHMYFRKDVGPLRLLFLDTNDLVYGDNGEDSGLHEPVPGSRAEAQMAWLTTELAEDDRGENALTIAMLHHPFIQSSHKHRAQAAALWSYQYRGRTLPDVLLDGGVDVVLTGHTHSTERFLVRRHDGRQLRLVNLSGRPRDGFLWFGSGSRAAHDLVGREHRWLARQGWRGLEGWTIRQEDAMTHDEVNQCGLFSVDAAGVLSLEMVYLEDDGGMRREAPVPLH